MDIKNNGIELDVYDNEENHLGDLIVSKKGLTWCKGKTSRENGFVLKWEKFIQLVEDQK